MSQPTGRSRKQWEAFIDIDDKSKKIPREELIKQMVADGLSEQEAQSILSRDKRSKIKTSWFMLFGGLAVCIFGILIDISSCSVYNEALETGRSGYFYFYFGLIICGAVAFFIGLYRLITRKN